MPQPNSPPLPLPPAGPRATRPALESAESLRLLIDNVKEYAIFMLDSQGRIVTWNPGAERIKGYTAPEIIGQHISEFHSQEDIASGTPARMLAVAAAHGKERGRRLARAEKRGSALRQHRRPSNQGPRRAP